MHHMAGIGKSDLRWEAARASLEGSSYQAWVFCFASAAARNGNGRTCCLLRPQEM